MSHPFDQKELMDLVDAVCRDALDHDSWIRLEELLLANRDARAMYRRYVNSHIGLKQYLATREVGPPQKPAKSPVLGMLGTGVQRVVDFCWSATPFSILVAVGLPLVCVLLLVIQVRRPEPIQNATVSAPVRVARLNRTLDCEWTDEAPTPVVGESFATDRHIGLVRGLAEMTMADGTTVIVEGPATLRFRSPREVSLKSGKLTAQVPKRARGFTVMTPRVSVVDLGTEFGVSVENEEGQAEVHVFQGEVELRSAKDGNQKDATPQRLAAGRVVRVEPSSSRGQMVIRNIATSTNQFVRRLPIASEASKPTVDDKRSRPTVVADFSGGNGSSEVDQFPGVPGLGWATDWELGEIEEVDSIASIENTNPVLGGGDYLRVLATRRFGTDHVRRCVCRRLDLNSPVDLKKRHVVFFDVRLDVMDSVDDPRDAITICSNSKRGRELDNDLSAGWHIRAKGPRQGQGQASARDWHFSTSNGRGRVRDFGSDVAVCQGKTYSFRILVDPEARTWTPSIAVDGGRFKKFGAMGMRSSGTAEIRGYWPYLHFRWEMAGGNKGNRLERIGFSVDSIRIVPADQAGLADSGDYRDKDNAKSPRAL